MHKPIILYSIRKSKKYLRILYVLSILFSLIACNEKAEVITLKFENNELMLSKFEKINGYHVKNGFAQKNVKRLDALSNSNPIFIRYYKKGLIDRHVSSVFKLGNNPTITIHIYKSAFGSNAEYNDYVKGLINNQNQ